MRCAAKKSKDFMLIVNETIDQLAMVSSVHWYGDVLRRDGGDVLRRDGGDVLRRDGGDVLGRDGGGRALKRTKENKGQKINGRSRMGKKARKKQDGEESTEEAGRGRKHGRSRTGKKARKKQDREESTEEA